MSDHVHDFGIPEPNAVRMCAVDDCIEMRAATTEGWRELTKTEQTEVTVLMFEDVIMAQAMQMIHGTTAGLAKYRSRVGYDRPNDA